MMTDEKYMQRALQLAGYGRGSVSPNPMVGCVLTTDEGIIGEGWHRQYGGPHAEVQAVRDAARQGNESRLRGATAYVTLEPCSHFGKTPPCADLLIEKGIRRVVVANEDPNPLVAGRGMRRLREAGIEVESGLCASDGGSLNRRFFTFFNLKRPYVILKWAETADGYMAGKEGQPVQISNQYSAMQVHKWRAEEDSILIGRNTAMTDNPRLNVRMWKGRNPVRIVLDRNLTLPESLHVFDGTQFTILYNYTRQTVLPEVPERYLDKPSLSYGQISSGDSELSQLLTNLYERKIQSVLVEGGAEILVAFMKAGLWDEIRRCQSTLLLHKGIKAPTPVGTLIKSERIESDLWTYYRP